MRMPVVASKRVPTAFGSTAPPVTAMRTVATSVPGFQLLVSAAIDVGTPPTTVTPKLSTRGQ